MTDRLETLAPELESFAHELVVALINLELHSPYSTDVQDSLEQILEDLRKIVGDGLAALRVEFGEHELSVASRPQLGASLQAKKLLDLAAAREVAALDFDPRLDAQELLRFLKLFRSAESVDAFRSAAISRALDVNGIRHVKIERRAAPAGDPALDAGTRSALRGYQELADCLQESHVAASHGYALSLDRAAGVVEQAMQEMDREPSGLLSLAIYDDIDSFTVGHSVRVALLALQVARAAGADEPTLLKTGTAALLHDIGKSRIPQRVLFKRGPLDDDEWAIMSMHPRLGGEILIEQPDIDPAAIGAAFCHHMTPGGGGYPRPTLPFEPSGVSDLVRVCDVFEALTSIRPYKPALTPVEAYVIMHRKPGDFDRRWLRFFVDAIGLFPLGTKLELSTGERATVVGRGARRDRPRVRIVSDADGGALPDGAPSLVEVGQEVDGVTRTIRAVLTRHTQRSVGVEHPAHVHGRCC